VVLRADFGRIVVRAGANVQDNSVLHGGVDPATEIGPGATVGHLCVVHGALVGAEALIGNGSTVQDGARIGRRSLVGAGSLVPPGADIPDGVLAMGTPARVRGPLSEGAAGWVDGNPSIYRELARRHAVGIAEVDPVVLGDSPDGLHDTLTTDRQA
jgi:carbonic anhydrase/acetyltransferase-like protein (isoleucine patch superfamily)